MPILDDEVLPYTPMDETTPFVLEPSKRANSLFKDLFYTTQNSNAFPYLAGGANLTDKMGCQSIAKIPFSPIKSYVPDEFKFSD